MAKLPTLSDTSLTPHPFLVGVQDVENVGLSVLVMCGEL